MVGRNAQDVRGTLMNIHGTSHHLTTVGQPIRMRCLLACLHDATCRAVNYKTSFVVAGNCALLSSNPQQHELVLNNEWNGIILK